VVRRVAASIRRPTPVGVGSGAIQVEHCSDDPNTNNASKEEQALELPRTHRKSLGFLAEALLEQETLDEQEAYEAAGIELAAAEQVKGERRVSARSPSTSRRPRLRSSSRR
jgi:hypothetical protein